MSKYNVYFINTKNKLCVDEVIAKNGMEARKLWLKNMKPYGTTYCYVLKKSEYNRDRNRYAESVISHALSTQKLYTVFYREKKTKYYNPPIFVVFVYACNFESAKHIIRNKDAEKKFAVLSAKRCSTSKYTINSEKGEVTDLVGFESLKDSVDYLNKHNINYYVETPIVVDFRVRFKKINIISQSIDFSILT